MKLINKRMTMNEMFRLYPNQWIAYGDPDDNFDDEHNSDGEDTAILIAICDTQHEAIMIPFEGEGYKVTGMGVCNSKHWKEETNEEYFLSYDFLVGSKE